MTHEVVCFFVGGHCLLKTRFVAFVNLLLLSGCVFNVASRDRRRSLHTACFLSNLENHVE